LARWGVFAHATSTRRRDNAAWAEFAFDPDSARQIRLQNDGILAAIDARRSQQAALSLSFQLEVLVLLLCV